MKHSVLILLILFFCPLVINAQAKVTDSTAGTALDFVSDTQQPMLMERIYLHSNHNARATSMIFDNIIRRKPQGLFMLGDIVALGHSNHRWVKIDKFIDSCRAKGIAVYGLLGNHDVMGMDKRGERNFQKRFPAHLRTGYFKVLDSVAVLMVNSNFGSLSKTSLVKQREWYKSTLVGLDTNAAIKAVIVTCHHAPYSNSTVIKPSVQMQQQFVPAFIESKKARLFITGHAHAFEHFRYKGKDFLVIGGGGGLHHPLKSIQPRFTDLASGYKPMFHYLSVHRLPGELQVTSFFIKEDFSGLEKGYRFSIPVF